MFNIKLEKEDVDNFIKNALLESTLGTRLKDAINKNITEAIEGYSSPVKTLVQEEVRIVLRKILAEDPWRTKIQTMVATHLTEKYIETVMGNALSHAVKSMEDRSY